MGDLLNTHWVLSFTLWATFMFTLIFLLGFGEKLYFFKKWISWNIIILLFLSGILGYQLNMPTSAQNHFSTFYLDGDYVIGEIVDYQIGNGDYDKAILSVQQVVKPHKKRYVQGQMLCYIKRDEKPFSEGSVVIFEPALKPIKNKNNPGEFNADPLETVASCRRISPRAVLRHDYMPHDFTVFLYRSPNSLS